MIDIQNRPDIESLVEVTRHSDAMPLSAMHVAGQAGPRHSLQLRVHRPHSASPCRMSRAHTRRSRAQAFVKFVNLVFHRQSEVTVEAYNIIRAAVANVASSPSSPPPLLMPSMRPGAGDIFHVAGGRPGRAGRRQAGPRLRQVQCTLSGSSSSD